MKKYLALALLISTTIQGMPKSRKKAKQNLMDAAKLQKLLSTYEQLESRNQESDERSSANPIIVEIGSFNGTANPQTPNAISKAPAN